MPELNELLKTMLKYFPSNVKKEEVKAALSWALKNKIDKVYIDKVREVKAKIDEGEESLALRMAKETLNNPRALGIEKRKAIFTIAEVLLRRFHFIFYLNELYVYESGVYQPNGENFVVKYIRDLEFKEELLQKDLIEIINYIKGKTYTEKIQTENKYIAIENGILDVEKREVLPFNPNIVLFSKLPVKYDKNAKCPTIINFLSDIMADKYIYSLQEFLGSLLLKDYRFKTALLLYGPTDAGKSTLINLIKNFVGVENISSMPLDKLTEGKNSFIMYSLRNKIANLSGELSSKSLRNVDIFKNLTGGDPIDTDIKFSKLHITFDNYAKLIFATNEIPRINSINDDAFFNRWILIELPNIIPKEKKDRTLLKKITTPEELSGFLNFVLDGLQRILHRGEIWKPHTLAAVKKKYIQESDSVAFFVTKRLEKKEGARINKKELYKEYVDYSLDNGFNPADMRLFFKRLLKMMPIREIQARFGDKRERELIGVELVDEKQDSEDKQEGYDEEGVKVVPFRVKYGRYLGTIGTMKNLLLIYIKNYSFTNNRKNIVPIVPNEYIFKTPKVSSYKYEPHDSTSTNLTHQILSDLKQWEQPDEPGVVSAEIIFSNPNLLGWAEDKLNHFNNMVKEGIFQEVRSGFYFSEALRDFAPDSEAPSKEIKTKKEV